MWLSVCNPQVIILGLYRWRKWGGKKSDFQLPQDNRYLKCMKLIKFYVLLFGNLGFRLISTEYAATKITPLVTTKGTNLTQQVLLSAPKFMSSEHKMSGTASAGIREPSQTANLRFLKSSPQQPCLCSHSLSVTTEDKGGVGLTLIPASILCKQKNALTDVLANSWAHMGGGSQSKNLPDLGLVSRETNQLKKKTKKKRTLQPYPSFVFVLLENLPSSFRSPRPSLLPVICGSRSSF